MTAMNLLVIASRYERERICHVAAAAGGRGLPADHHDDFAGVLGTLRADAAIVADAALADASATLVRLRSAIGARVPIVFLGDAGAANRVQPLVAASFARPLAPEALGAGSERAGADAAGRRSIGHRERRRRDHGRRVTVIDRGRAC